MAYVVSNGTSIPHANGHYDLLSIFKNFVEGSLGSGNNWTNVRHDVSGDDHEEIWLAPGAGGTYDYFYCGLKTSQSIASDYYNIKVQGFTGYVSDNSFETQPGRCPTDLAVLLYNTTIPYVIVANENWAFCYADITDHSVSFYMGKPLTFALPYQYPYPFVLGAMSDSSTVRYDVAQVSWWKGSGITGLLTNNHCRLRFVDGNWRNPQIFPYWNTHIFRNTISDSDTAEGYYAPMPLTMTENTTGYINNYGEIDGVYHISGFNNEHMNTVVIDGITYLVIRDNVATGINDLLAIKLQ